MTATSESQRVELLGLSAPFDRAFAAELAAVSERTPARTAESSALALGPLIQLVNALPSALEVQRVYETDLLSIARDAKEHARTVGFDCQSLTLPTGVLDSLAHESPCAVVELATSAMSETVVGLVDARADGRLVDSWSDAVLIAAFVLSAQALCAACFRRCGAEPAVDLTLAGRCMSSCRLPRRCRSSAWPWPSAPRAPRPRTTTAEPLTQCGSARTSGLASVSSMLPPQCWTSACPAPPCRCRGRPTLTPP